jgi:hypothetical protein
MPDTIDVVVGMLVLSSLYLASAAVLEGTGLTDRLPLAPKPVLSLGVSLANCLLAYSMFKAIGWVRPVVAVLPLGAYPLEYGLNAPAPWSEQGFELLASALVLPIAAVYCLYINSAAKRWFQAKAPLSPNTSLERTREG